MIPQKVQIFSIHKSDRNGKRRYWTRWRIDGRDRTRSFKTKAEAERLRSRLLVAQADGHRFDLATGYPVAWHQSTSTWWSWSSEWLGLKWPQWAGNTRRSGAEALVAVTPTMVKPRAPKPPDGLKQWLLDFGFRPDLPDSVREGRELAWLERWSIPLAELTPSLLEKVIAVATTRQDGQPMAATTTRRRRNLIKSVLDAAVRRDELDANPMLKMEWRMPKRSVEIDISVVPSVSDIMDVYNHIASLDSPGRRYAAFFATIGLSGMRPSEVAGLQVTDLLVPPDGWGLARLRGALTTPGTRYSGSSGVTQSKGLKHRAASDVREVPLPPSLVAILRRHLDDFPTHALVFTNNVAAHVTPHNYGKAWGRARTDLWPPPHALSRARVYDLRHSAATTMLAAGVNPAEVALRLGHSVDMLMRVYAGVFADERRRANEQIEAMIDKPSLAL